MAEQKKANEALNVEEALSQSEAFLIKNKKAIIGAVVAVIIIVAGIVMYKNAKKKHRLHCSKDRNTLRPTFTNRP
jgi:hypothetical protein